MSNPKSVIIMISSLGGGGAERIAARLASELADRGDNVFVMPFSKTGRPYPLSERVHVADYSIYDLRKRVPQPLQTLRIVRTGLRVFPRLVALRRSEHVDATVSLLLSPNILNVMTPGRCRRILCERNNPARKGALRFALSRWVYRHGDCVVFQTEYVKSLFSPRVQSRGVVIPNPVEVSCKACPIEDRDNLIVSAGRHVPQKNHALLLRAFARFLEVEPTYRLQIFGDGPLRAQLLELVEELGIQENVSLEPFCDDLHERISKARMFVLSSDFEGMPNALLEAMAMGLACISTKYPSAEEVVEDGVDGILVPTGDVDALADAMIRVAGDTGLQERLSKTALEHSERFALETVIPQWEAIL